MSVFGDLKRLFFGAKSVAKHQGGKAVDAIKDTAEDLADKAGDTWQDVKDEAGDLADRTSQALDGLGDKVQQGTEAAWDKTTQAGDKAGDWLNEQWAALNTDKKESASIDLNEEELVADPHAPDLPDLDMPDMDIPDSPKTATGPIDFEAGLEGRAKSGEPSAWKEAADNALDSAAKAGLKAKETAEQLGGKVMEKGDELLSAAAEKGAELKEKFDAMVEKAGSAAEAEAAAEAAEKARVEAEIEAAKNKSFGGNADARDTSETTLGGTDSFFDRAARFAEGDYHDEGGKDQVLQENPDYKKPEKGGDILGFDDKDGDGDALIDDAEVEDV